MAQSIELSSNLLMIVSVFNSSIFKFTFLCFLVKMFRNRGNKVDDTVGIIPTLRVPPMVPSLLKLHHSFSWILQ